MSQGFVRRLLDPATRQAVLQARPINTADARKSVLAGKTAPRNTVTALAFDYEHVPKADRVAYFDLRPDGIDPEILNLHLEDQIVSTQFRSWGRSKRLRPLFYLPYRRNGTTRMKLSEPLGYEGPPVRFFTTAAIDGCSIYIEGDAATPKVTHVNAQAIQPTVEGDSWQAKRRKVLAKTQAMDASFGRVRSPIQPPRPAAVVVERPNYMVERPSQRQLLLQRFAQSRGVPAGHAVDYQPFGAVLGFKDGDVWSFWLQKNGRFEWMRNADDPPERYQVTYWVAETRLIWPNGPGYFRLV